MSGWRAMNSILVLRDQANEAAPNRGKGADGTVCDENHPTDSDHCPHNVPGVGSDMVTALDLTHDPAHGFDSYKFAEVLRVNRDRRIKYVISNKKIFSSYQSGSRAPWTWGSYSGVDPHTNHVHVSVLDDPVSDTTTPWNLEGFMAFTEDEKAVLRAAPYQYQDPGQPSAHSLLLDPNGEYRTALAMIGKLATAADLSLLSQQVDGLKQTTDQILALLLAGGTGGGPVVLPPPVYHFEGTATPQV